MTRIIAGAAARVSLAVPRSGTRPTSDRVREALFSALEARDALEGARVLDLYAGSGALGLEALSRGAVSAVLVERDATAAALCRRNADAVLTALRASGDRTDHLPSPSVEVRAAAVDAFLRGAPGPFDLVFSDPPYGVADSVVAADLALLAPLLADGAVVVVERSSRSPAPAWPAGIRLEAVKKYGETALYVATTP